MTQSGPGPLGLSLLIKDVTQLRTDRQGVTDPERQTTGRLDRLTAPGAHVTPEPDWMNMLFSPWT